MDEQQNTVDLYFKIHYYTQVGRSLFISGNLEQLGLWNPSKAFPLEYHQGNWWSGVIRVNRVQNMPIEYKFIVNYTKPTCDFVEWEKGPNRIVDQSILDRMAKSEYFISERWGYRTIRFKLCYQLADLHMYIIGSNPKLGSWHTPMKMDLKLKKNGMQEWSFEVDVDPINFWIRYYYVKKNEKAGTMIWERGPGRVVQQSDFKNKEQNRKFVNQGNHTHFYYQSSTEYDYQNQGFGFQYYISFGRYNIIDSNFDTHFQIDQINENIIIGPYPQNQEDVQVLKQQNVQAVLNLQTQYDIEQRGINSEQIKQYYKEANITQISFEILDMNVEDFIRLSYQSAKTLRSLVNKYEKVYVHCTCGIGRAPSTVVLYMVTCLQYNLQDAVKLVKQKRPAFFINWEMLKYACQKSATLNGNMSNLYQYI